jgi:hypothetical protein
MRRNEKMEDLLYAMYNWVAKDQAWEEGFMNWLVTAAEW